MLQSSRKISNKFLTKVMKDDVNNKCRTCLAGGTIPILEDGNALNIKEAIKIIADIDVEEDDEYPKHLCDECYSLLRGAMLFKKLAQQSDHILRNEPYHEENATYCQLDTPSDDSLPRVDEKRKKKPQKKTGTLERKTLKLKKRCPNLVKPSIRRELKLSTRVPNSEEQVTCHVCSKELAKCDYKIHLEDNHCTPCIDPEQHNLKLKSLRVECNLCKKTLHNQWVIKHFTTVHAKNPARNYVCDICGNSYLYKAGLYNHSQLHNKEFPYKCTQCPYRGKTSTNLKAHLQIHSTNYKYKCADCPAKYRHWSQLNIHKRKHRAPEIKCVECTKLFHTPMAMEKHYKIQHMGIKSHVCNICNTAYSYRKSLVTHQNRVHNRMRLPSGGTPAYLRLQANKTD